MLEADDEDYTKPLEVRSPRLVTGVPQGKAGGVMVLSSTYVHREARSDTGPVTLRSAHRDSTSSVAERLTSADIWEPVTSARALQRLKYRRRGPQGMGSDDLFR